MDNFDSYFDYHYSNVGILKMIAGDTSDNISGLQNIGEQKVLKYFPEIKKQTVNQDWIIDRTKESPHFTATPEVIFDNGIYKAWFTSCMKWEKIDNEVKHFYNLEYAESTDGINWKRDKNIAIDFKDEFEYALGVPRVKKDNNLYKMWFCSRATQDIPTYRIRYAESNDGIIWVRKDEEVGIDVSKDGWDSEMICYPFIFDHKDKRYMLYNGNGYGRTGFGIAILEK
jgi:5'-3' exonuclease